MVKPNQNRHTQTTVDYQTTRYLLLYNVLLWFEMKLRSEKKAGKQKTKLSHTYSKYEYVCVPESEGATLKGLASTTVLNNRKIHRDYVLIS